jgi:hypothetical protein
MHFQSTSALVKSMSTIPKLVPKPKNQKCVCLGLPMSAPTIDRNASRQIGQQILSILAVDARLSILTALVETPNTKKAGRRRIFPLAWLMALSIQLTLPAIATLVPRQDKKALIRERKEIPCRRAERK